MTSRALFGAIAAVALAVTVGLSACSGDDTADQPPATAPGGSIAPPSIPDDTIGRDVAPPLDTTATGDTFLETITGDSTVTADELEAAYRSYIDCLTAMGVHGVYAWDVSLDVGPVLDGLSITGDDPAGARLRSAQAECARDRLGDARRLYDAANPQDPADLLARQRASLRACIEAISPAVAASLPDDVTVDTEVDGLTVGELQLDPTLIGADPENLLAVERCLGSLGAPYRSFG